MFRFGIKVIVFFCLFIMQIVVVLVYKFSQTNGKYAYSTVSVMIVAEISKFLISLNLTICSHAVGEESLANSKLPNKFVRLSSCVVDIQRQISNKFLRQTFLLALLYCINNQIAFFLFQYVDVVTISLFRSFTSFQSAMLLWILFARPINRIQWSTIILQVIGLIIVQYDACKKMPIFEAKLYIILLLNCSISSVCTVWNEHLLKTYSVTIHIQNMALYFFGSIANMCLFMYSYKYSENYSKGFFEGYSLSVFAVVLCNSLLGLVITAVYKYADAIIKTFSSACATGALLILNWSLFHQETSLTATLGAAVIFIASYIYFCAATDLSSPRLDVVLKETQRGRT